MHVLEYEQERLRVGELLGPLQRRPGQLLRRPLALGGAETPSATASRSATASLSQLTRSFSNASVSRVVVGDPGARLDHRGERPVRDAFAVRQRSAGEDCRALDALNELGDEARLAEAGLAEDRDELCAPVAHGARKRVLEELELLLAADERRLDHAAPCRRACGPHATSTPAPNGP